MTFIFLGERPYACVICDQRFTQKYDMVKHTRRHQDYTAQPIVIPETIVEATENVPVTVAQ